MNLDAFSNRDPWIESSEVIDHINNCKPPTPPPPTFEKLVVEKPLPLVSSAATAEAVLHAADSLKENPNNPMTTIHIKEEILEENVIVKKEPGVPENDVDDKTLLLHLQPQVILKEEPPFIKEEILWHKIKIKMHLGQILLEYETLNTEHLKKIVKFILLQLNKIIR